MRIDCHAHVFHGRLTPATDARYWPATDAPLERYLAFQDASGIASGVLVQPSFLGTDNAYLLESLAAAAGRLAGVAVVEPDIDFETLAAMAALGVRGVRLNMIERPAPALAASAPPALLKRIEALGWLIEIQAASPDLPLALRLLDDFSGPVIIDHFGRPDPSFGRNCPGFRTLLRQADDPRLHIKLSAPYRFAPLDPAPIAALLLQATGPDRLLWGTDWPWTQHESGRDLAALSPSAFGIDAVASARMDAAAARLFRFARAADA